MEKATLVAKYAQTEEDKLVLSRVLDRICQGVARQIPTATEFLTARERVLAEQMLQAADMGPVRFSGGREERNGLRAVTFRITWTRSSIWKRLDQSVSSVPPFEQTGP